MSHSTPLWFAGISFTLATSTAFAQAPASPQAQPPSQAQPSPPQPFKVARPVEIARVKGDLYMISGEGGNVAVYATGAGVILVDDMFYRNADDIVAKVATVTSEPIVYVLNTHQHDDHAGGNAKLLEIANVIAHENVRTNLSDIKQPYYEDTPGTPIGLRATDRPLSEGDLCHLPPHTYMSVCYLA